MKDKHVIVAISPDFKNLLKIEAAKKGKSVIEYTKDLAKEKNPVEDIISGWDKKVKKVNRIKGYDFL